MSVQLNAPSKMREANAKAINLALDGADPGSDAGNTELRDFRKMIERKHGFDPLSDAKEHVEKFPVREAGFNWKKVKAKLQEADSASSFPQLLRAGVQNIANGAYKTVETTFEDWVKVVPSSKDTELYAPMHGVGFPREVGRQEKFPEVTSAGLDISLKNRDYGTIWSLERQLIDDDQTGQMQQQASLLGEYMKLLCEALVYGKLASVANMSYAEFKIPVTETEDKDETASGYPWVQSSGPLIGGGYNRPATFGLLTKDTFQDGQIALMNQLNKLGLKMSAQGRRLLIGPKNQFVAAILMNSSFYPSGAAAAGATGGAMAINPIKGLADISVSRFMFKQDGTCAGDSLAWYLTDDTKPAFVLQMRQAMAMEQEAENSGESFERKVTRFSVWMRGNADFIDPRFFWQGNNGSVTS